MQPKILAATLLALLCTGSLAAQGTLSLATTTQATNTSGFLAMQWAIEAHGPVEIWRVGMQANAGTRGVDVWYRPGGMSTVVGPTSGWVLAGSLASHNFVLGINQIPIDINQLLLPNQSLGIAVIYHTGSSFSYNTSPNPQSVSNADMTLNLMGWRAGTYAAANVPSVSNWTVSSNSTTNLQVWYDPGGPGLDVNATQGSRQLVAANAQGPGNNGIEAGKFTIDSNSEPGAELISIDIKADGTGNPVNSFSSVQIWRDDNANGVFDFGVDVLIDTITAFPASGVATFTVPNNPLERGFSPNTTKTYFVVVKMSGLGAPTATFDFVVEDIVIGAGTVSKRGLPSATMQGVQIDAPTLTAQATPGSAQLVLADEAGPGGNGLEVATFTVTNGAMAGGELKGIEISASGTGNDAADYAEVSVYEEEGTAPGFQYGQDILIDTYTAFPTNNGTLMFDVPAARQIFGANQVRQYYIVVRLSGSATVAATFNFRVTDLDVTGSFKAGLPTAFMTGLQIRAPEFLMTDHSAPTQETVFMGATGVVIQAFGVEYSAGASQSFTGFTLRGLGSGHDVDHVDNVHVYLDVNGDGLLDAGDLLLATGNYNLNNGSVIFDVSAQPAFTAPESRRYLIVYDFNQLPPDGATFSCYIQGASAQIPGTMILGLPLPNNTTGTAGVVVNANLLTVTLAGPQAATSVSSNSTGPSGDGLLLADVIIQAPPAHAWTLTSLTFAGSGSGSQSGAYAQLLLYEDGGSGIWDGAANHTLAAAIINGGFDAGTNEATLALSNPALGQTQSRRFFLVGKMNGTATAGQTFNARLEALDGSTAVPGVILGVPTADADALVIDDAVLTIAAAPNAPSGNILRKSGQSAQIVFAGWRLTASNDHVDVNSLRITTTATNGANWNNDVAAASGIQLWRDNGDGVFDSATDTMLSQAGGGASVLMTFAPPLNIPSNTSVDLWVVVNLLDSAGVGASASAATYGLGVASPGDVSATGTPHPPFISRVAPPTSVSLRIIDFYVTSFTPLTDVNAGGAAITIQGSGFISPISLKIGNVTVAGTSVITGGGTQITGLVVPAGSGRDLAIEISSGGLPPETLAETFAYRLNTGGGSSGGGGGCAQSGSSFKLGLFGGLVAILTLAWAFRRRRA